MSNTNSVDEANEHADTFKILKRLAAIRRIMKVLSMLCEILYDRKSLFFPMENGRFVEAMDSIENNVQRAYLASKEAARCLGMQVDENETMSPPNNSDTPSIVAGDWSQWVQPPLPRMGTDGKQC